MFNLRKSNYEEYSLRTGSRLSHMRERWRVKRSRACALMLLCMFLDLCGKHYPFLCVKITEEIAYHGALYCEKNGTAVKCRNTHRDNYVANNRFSIRVPWKKKSYKMSYQVVTCVKNWFSRSLHVIIRKVWNKRYIDRNVVRYLILISIDLRFY